MPLMAYRCVRCGLTKLAFSDELHRLSVECKDGKACDYKALPLTPTVVHSTNVYASEPLLDSIKTLEELDAQLTAEAEEERAVKILNEARTKN